MHKYLIVNADDYGMSLGINRGILEAHKHGIVTSVSLMVHGIAAENAIEMATEFLELSIGLHLDLGEWIYRDGDWHCRHFVVSTHDKQAVRDQITRQLEKFYILMGRNPTHIDSHQHAHMALTVRPVVEEAAAQLGIPVRKCTARVRYLNGFAGQDNEGRPVPDAITAENLMKILDELEPGVTELGCHPGYAADADSTYREERGMEVKVLCDKRVRSGIDRLGIELCSFAQLPCTGGIETDGN